MMRVPALTLLVLFVTALISPARAQDHGGESSHQAHATPDAPVEARIRPMGSALAPGAPMTRDASGTAWLPDASPMDAIHGGTGAWSLMLHGAAFPRYTAQDVFASGTRGDAAFGAPNWAMGMAQRDVGDRGRLTARAMVSLDPLTEGGAGYPLLFQSGETWKGERLVDRQHPHDLFSELSLTYAYRIFQGTSLFGYLAYPGEPAVGPAAFMHRPSARFNPDSPLGHHWQDATHILFGVATAGIANRRFKLEQSFFTGAEPDEERFGFDRPGFDSYATRLSYNPTPNFAIQVSRAWLHEPEALEPGVDQVRTTASALFSRPIGSDGDLSAALVWGANDLRPDSPATDHHAGVQHALLVESALRLGPYAVHSRVEYTQKSPEELALDAHAYGEDPFDLLSFTLGGGRTLFHGGGFAARMGAQATVHVVPERLSDLYGGLPVSTQVYLRLVPATAVHRRQASPGAHEHH